MARLAALLLTTLLAASLSGCTVASDLQRFLDRAQGRVQYADAQLLSEQVDFALEDPPDPPPAQGRTTVVNFTVPSGARTLRVDATVTFDEEVVPVPLPLPPGVPRGQVRVAVISPDGEEGNTTFTEAGTWAYEAEDPARGDWGLRVQTFGQGSVFLLAVANAPAP